MIMRLKNESLKNKNRNLTQQMTHGKIQEKENYIKPLKKLHHLCQSQDFITHFNKIILEK